VLTFHSKDNYYTPHLVVHRTGHSTIQQANLAKHSAHHSTASTAQHITAIQAQHTSARAAQQTTQRMPQNSQHSTAHTTTQQAKHSAYQITTSMGQRTPTYCKHKTVSKHNTVCSPQYSKHKYKTPPKSYRKQQNHTAQHPVIQTAYSTAHCNTDSIQHGTLQYRQHTARHTAIQTANSMAHCSTYSS
jgi:hypothetical protein